MELLSLLMSSSMKQRRNHTLGNRQDSLVLLHPNMASEVVTMVIMVDTIQHQLLTTSLLLIMTVIILLLPTTNPLLLLRH